jgi:hypothetical protein
MFAANPPSDLSELNRLLSESLKTLHTDESAYRQAHLMEVCQHSLDSPDERAEYCRCSLCLLCRRERAIGERRFLMRQLDTALASFENPALIVFQTFTLQDALPEEVGARAGLLVKAFGKLLRKRPLRHQRGWARTIETKRSSVSPDLENVHMHCIFLFPSGAAEDIGQIDWDGLWRQCAGDLARDTDADWGVARKPGAVVAYLTKAQVWDFAEDGMIGCNDPARYVRRVRCGHQKFSYGGRLKLKVIQGDIDLRCGLGSVPLSTQRGWIRQREVKIPIEGE